MTNPYISCLLLTSCSILSSATAQDTLPGERDPWEWPFEATSIWNMPIGSAAEFQYADLGAAANVGVDVQHLLELNADDPVREFYGSPGWEPVRCGGDDALGFSLPIPDDWIVPDVGDSPYGYTPNGTFAFRLPDSDDIAEGNMVSRCEPGGRVYVPKWKRYPDNRKIQSLRGDGLQGGGQGASGLSALGGTIRKGELTDDEPIRHALKINPYADVYCYYSEEIPGFRWPAVSADRYAPGQYSGTNPEIVMGSLFAIPRGITAECLGLESPAARKLFFTLQNYGAYFTEDAAWDVWDLIVERDVEVEFQEAFGISMSDKLWRDDVNKLMQSLYVVVNNGPESVGGGGEPLQPLAPGFGDSTSFSQPDVTNRSTLEFTQVPGSGRSYRFAAAVDVTVHSVDGRLVAEYRAVESIDLAGLAAGIYVLTAASGEQQTVRQVVVE